MIINRFIYIYAKLLKKMRFASVKMSSIDSTSKVESGSNVVNSIFAKHTFCGYDCSIVNCDIGSFCSIAGNVTIGGVAHPVEYVSTSPVFLSHKDSVKAKFSNHHYLPEVRTVIGNDVWIGEGAFVKAGVKVGHGAVVGMGSVVTKDVPSYAIVAGNPARLIRMRFEDDMVEALLKLRWWDKDDEELKAIAELFHQPRELLAREGLM